METKQLLIVVFALALLSQTMLVYQYVSQLNSLPSPIFGGDFYYQLGAVAHLYRAPAQEWLSSSNGIGALPGYFPVYGVLTALFGKIAALSPLQAMLWFNIILAPLSIILFFLFFRELFSNDWFGLAGALLASPFTSFPILKYTNFTQFIIVPALLLCALLFYKKQSMQNAILLGALYGIAALSHGTAFIFCSAFIVLLFAFLLYKDKANLSFTPSYFLSKKEFVIAVAIGLAMAQSYWFSPIFEYGGKSKLGSLLWSFEDFGMPSVQRAFVINALSYLFFDASSLFRFVASIAALGGLILLFKARKIHGEKEGFISLLLIASAAMTFSFFVTMPLLGTHFSPDHMLYLFFLPSTICISLIGLHAASVKIKNPLIISAAFAILFALNILLSFGPWHSGQWYAAGKYPIPSAYADLGNYLSSNSSIHDRVLSDNELSFMINSVSGNDVLMSRRAQNDAFADFDSYQLDGIIMLYGNDTGKKLEIAKNRNVKYLYFDSNWISHTSAGYDFPLLMYSESNERALSQNGIAYTREKGYVDPSVRGINVRKFDLLLISTSNEDQTGLGPWKDDLDQYLSVAWSYGTAGRPEALLYAINT